MVRLFRLKSGTDSARSIYSPSKDRVKESPDAKKMASRRGAGESNKQMPNQKGAQKGIHSRNSSNTSGRKQGSTTSGVIVNTLKLKKPVEVICLTDSEELYPKAEPKKLDTNQSLIHEDDSKEESMERQAENLPPEIPKTPPKVDLQTYYKNNGLSLSHVRRLNRNYVRHDGPSSEARGIVFWDSYSPPPGYTEEDVPLNESQSQPKEEVVSPAILNAAQYKLKPSQAITISDSDEDLQDLLSRLTKRKAVDPDKENPSEHPKKKSTPPDHHISSPNPAPLNITFPDDDDLNDSELIMCTQAAEMEYNDGAGPKVQVTDKKIESRKTNAVNTGPTNTSTPIGKPANSIAAFKSMGSETPKSAKSLGRNMRSRGNISSTFSSSLFESSSVTSANKSFPKSSGPNPPNNPRKIIFPEPPTCITVSPITSGDFADDEDDLLFSQIELPLGENVVNKSDGDVADQSTEIINRSDSFLMGSGFLNEIDKLEEMAICSDKGNKNAVSSLNALTSLKDDLQRQSTRASSSTVSSMKNIDSPNTAARKLRGLGRNVANRK